MIRPYTPTDREAVLELLALNTPQYFDPSEAPGFANYLDNEAEWYYVAEKEGKVIGCGGYNRQTSDGSDMRICWDIVHPDFHGRGIGAALLRHRINAIRKDPAVNVISVRTSQLTHGFYAKLGFQLQHVEKDFWAKGFDLYEMTMKI